MQPGWPKDAHPHREVAAAPEALEHSAGEEGAPKEQEGDEGDIGHIVATGPQELPASTQALGPAQPGQGGGRLSGQGRQRGGVTHGHLRPAPAPRPPAREQGLYLPGGQGRGERRVIPCGAVTCKGTGGSGCQHCGDTPSGMTGTALPSGWLPKLSPRAQGARWGPMGPLRPWHWLMSRDHQGGMSL